MEISEKDQLITRLNIVVNQRNSFLDQIVLLQEQFDNLSKAYNELKEKHPEVETNEVKTVEAEPIGD